EVMTEVTTVAHAEGVEMERLLGALDPDWLALDDNDRRSPGSPTLLAKHAVLLAVGARYRRLRSSMLSALERGRVPPVDFLNGEVVSRAERHGLAVPMNRALVASIQRLATEGERPSLEHLQRFYDDTRSELRSLSWAA
ncbi:MAG: ketopantoate reductase family protein, partial [Myxococcota bacterium]